MFCCNLGKKVIFLKNPNNKHHLLQAKYDLQLETLAVPIHPNRHISDLQACLQTHLLHPKQSCYILSRPAPTQLSSLAWGNWSWTAQPMFVFKEAFHLRASLCKNTTTHTHPKRKKKREKKQINPLHSCASHFGNISAAVKNFQFAYLHTLLLYFSSALFKHRLISDLLCLHGLCISTAVILF